MGGCRKTEARCSSTATCGTGVRVRVQSAQAGQIPVSGRPLPGVVGFVSGRVVAGDPLAPLGGRLQLPVVDLVEEHLGELRDGLTFFRRQVAEFVLDKVVHALFGETDGVTAREQGFDPRGKKKNGGSVHSGSELQVWGAGIEASRGRAEMRTPEQRFSFRYFEGSENLGKILGRR